MIILDITYKHVNTHDNEGNRFVLTFDETDNSVTVFDNHKRDGYGLYTLDKVRFKEEWNKDCLITDLEGKLQELTMKYNNGNYIITAIDTHW